MKTYVSDIVKTSVLPKLMNKFNAIPTKFQQDFLLFFLLPYPHAPGPIKLVLTFIWKNNSTQK